MDIFSHYFRDLGSLRDKENLSWSPPPWAFKSSWALINCRMFLTPKDAAASHWSELRTPSVPSAQCRNAKNLLCPVSCQWTSHLFTMHSRFGTKHRCTKQISRSGNYQTVWSLCCHLSLCHSSAVQEMRSHVSQMDSILGASQVSYNHLHALLVYVSLPLKTPGE